LIRHIERTDLIVDHDAAGFEQIGHCGLPKKRSGARFQSAPSSAFARVRARMQEVSLAESALPTGQLERHA
jgi:hypothetical protein